VSVVQYEAINFSDFHLKTSILILNQLTLLQLLNVSFIAILVDILVFTYGMELESADKMFILLA